MVSRLHLRQPEGQSTRKKVVELVVSGPIGRWFVRRHWAAFTLPLPFVVLIFYWNTPAPSPLTRVHEFVHVAQDGASSIFFIFWLKYLVELARRGYRDNAYEREAFAIEDAARENGLPEWARDAPV